MSAALAALDPVADTYRGGLAAPPLRFEDVFDTKLHPDAKISWDVDDLLFGDDEEGNDAGPESFFDEEDTPDLYNAIEALHSHKPISFLLPRRDKAPMIVATSSKKGGRSNSRKAPGYIDLPTVPAGPAGILTCIDVDAGEQQPDTDQHDRDDGKRRRASGISAAAPPASSSRGSGSAAAPAAANRKRARATGLPSDAASLLTLADGGDELPGVSGEGGLRATNVHAASMPVVSSLLHLKHVPVEDACKAVGTATGSAGSAGGGGVGQPVAAYCSYADLYAKLQRIETNTVKPSETYRVFSRLPCALWTDPGSFCFEFLVISRDFPAFNIACATHAHEKAVKWKKSGSPQLRDMGAQCPGVQVMSQFAVARGLTDNSKAFSARVSCVVRVGEAQGIHLVQVRAAEVPVGGGGAGGGGKSAPTGQREAATARANLYPAGAAAGSYAGLGGVSSAGVPNMSASFQQLLASYGATAASTAQYSRLLAGQPWAAYPGSTALLYQQQLLQQQQQQQALAGLTGGGNAASFSAAMARAAAAQPAAAIRAAPIPALPMQPMLGLAPPLLPPPGAEAALTAEGKNPDIHGRSAGLGLPVEEQDRKSDVV